MEIFRAIIRGGSITEAARILGLSQPAVSTALRHAEDRLGMPLFRRSRGRIDPTPEALSLYPEVEALFQKYHAIRTYAADLKGAHSGLLSLAATPTLSYAYLARAVGRFKSRHPQVRIILDVTHTPQIVDLARTGQIDLGVIADPSQAANLVTHPLNPTELVAVMHARHPLAENAVVKPKDLERFRLITNTHHTLFHDLEQNFRRAGLNIDVAIAVNHNITTCLLLEDELSVAIVDPWMPTTLFPHLVCKRLRPRIEIGARLVWSEGRPRSRLAKAFTAVVLEADGLHRDGEAEIAAGKNAPIVAD